MAIIKKYNAVSGEWEAILVGEQGPPGPGGSGELVDDTTPQLGGMLDVNGQAIGDGTLELLDFTETASAVNHLRITNAATGAGPTLSAVGDDANIDLLLEGKGTGGIRTADDMFVNRCFSAVNGSLTQPAFQMASNGWGIGSTATTFAINQGGACRWRVSFVGEMRLATGIVWASDFQLNTVRAFLTIDADNILAQRNAANAQAFRLYNTYTDASNGEWLELDWQTTSNTLRLGTAANGTGVVRALELQAYRLRAVTVAGLPAAADSTRQRIEVSDALTPAIDATVVGGGAVAVTVRSDGTNWVVIEIFA